LNVAEKDSLIQTLQQSYSEVEDDLWASHGGEMSPTIKALSPSPTVMGILSPRSPNSKTGSRDRLHSATLVGDVSDGTTRLVSSMGSLNGDCSSPTGKTRLGALNLAVATSINDSSPSGQGKHTSSSVPNSPGVTHRLLHINQNPAKTVKSHSAESAWLFSGMQQDQKTPKSSPIHKTHSPNRRMLKSFSGDRHSPLAGKNNLQTKCMASILKWPVKVKMYKLTILIQGFFVQCVYVVFGQGVFIYMSTMLLYVLSIIEVMFVAMA